MLHTILPTQMQAAEQTAFAAGLSPLLTMETAARAAFDVLLDLLGCDCRGKNVLFLCGPGNNGGDGLVMARLLLQARGFARIILLDTPKTAEAQINLRHLQAMGADIEAVPDELLEDEYDAVVDALFGTGFTGSIAADSPAGQLLTWANTCGPMLSIDVPSGMDAATGAVEGVCARAIWTVTFHRPKPGLYLTERRDCVGEITVAPIGLPRELDPQGGLLVNEEGDLHTLLPDRPASAHKGDCGRTVIYAGSLGMAGAAMMSARAALHAGAGLTTVICPRAAMPVLQQEVPNATCLAAEDQPTPKCDALLMGCGIAENDDTYADMMRLKATDAYQVWDAGALNLLARHPQQLGARAVITPHVGEAARLLGWEIPAVLSDKLGAAEALRAKYGCNVVLKSAVTVMLTADGQQCALNAVGSPALAKGGSGDALAGILASLLGQGLPMLDAMRAACLWLGLAGIAAGKRCGVRAALTGDVIDSLGACEG